MARGTCSLDDCDDPVHARFLCNRHYRALGRQGRLSTSPTKRTDVLLRDVSGQKLCIRCRTWQLESNYSSNRTRKDGLSPYCKGCIQDVWVDEQRDKRYGLLPGTVKSLLEKQGRRCAICKAEIGDSAFVDHDHECCPGTTACGKCVRGLLCRGCNTLLGNAQDSIPRLLAAAEYLKKGKLL